MKNQSIRSHHLVIILAIVMTIVTGLLLIGLNKTTEKEIVKEYNKEQLHSVKDFSSNIETYINTRVEVVDLLSSLLAFRKYDSKFIKTEINHFYENEKGNFVTKLSLYDKTGTIIYSSSKDIIGHKLAESEIFRWAKNPENKGKQFISSPIKVPKVKGDSIPHIHFVIAVPIYNVADINDKMDSSQKFSGVVTETVDFDKLLQTLISNHQSDKVKEYLWVMEKNGTLLFHADHPEMAFANVQQRNESCMNCHISFQHIETMRLKKEGNIEYQLKNRPLKLASYTTLDYKNISWTLVLNMPSEQVAGFIDENLFRSYLLLGMIALTFFTISFFIYRGFKLRVRAEEETKQLREKSILKEKIEESEKRYRNLVESSPDAIAVHCGGILVYANEASAKLVGAFKPEDLIGKPALDILHPDYHEQTKKRIEQVLRTKQPSDLAEEKFIRLDGKVIDVDVIAIPTTYNNKDAVQVIVRDITNRKRAEKEIRVKENRMRMIVEGTPYLFFYTQNSDGRVTYISPSVEKITGHSVDEWINQSSWFVTDNKINEYAKERTHANLRGEFSQKPILLEIEHIDKHPILLEVYENPIIENDTVVGLQGVAHDITERKHAEEELRTRKAYLSAIIENQPGLLWLKDTKSRFLAVNQAFAAACGRQTPMDVIGKTDLDVWPREQAEKYRADDAQVMQSAKSVSIEELVYSNGEAKWFETFKTPVKDASGRIMGTTGYAHDITERIRANVELIKAKEKAEESDKLKSEFLAQISHEIRTPLNAIVGNVEYLGEVFDDNMDSDSRNCFEGINLASKRIIRTVDLVLNVAELQTSGYKPYLSSINLDSEVLQKLFHEHQLSAKQKGLEFVYNCKVNDWNTIADNYSVTQIFANLIDNAIKYTKKGKVEIQLDKNANNKIMVEIKDTGVGVSKEFLPKLFDPFLQEDTGYTRSYDGSGLGLTLVKNYCKINNATIEVESEKNVGSTFRVTFNN
ncbi:MAG: PAS domain S-box protein [Melioribacter sp.]|nr:PAS domain S-box protein [Melioribacter sp.]